MKLSDISESPEVTVLYDAFLHVLVWKEAQIARVERHLALVEQDAHECRLARDRTIAVAHGLDTQRKELRGEVTARALTVAPEN